MASKKKSSKRKTARRSAASGRKAATSKRKSGPAARTKSSNATKAAKAKKEEPTATAAQNGSPARAPQPSTGRLVVQKTYKLYLGGQFPRSESGRTIAIHDARDRIIGHVCRASRKDFRDAVRSARSATRSWARRSAYNRGQILYRMAEMLEGKGEEFAALLSATVPGGLRRARAEVSASIDRLVSFGGWADKFPQVLGCHNPVAGPYYNFTVPEPTGVVGVIAPDDEPLLGLVSLLAPPVCAGNTVVALGSQAHPVATAVLGEVCATSDVPNGVINLLTGVRDDILTVMAEHRDVDAIHACVDDPEQQKSLQLGAAENVKRVRLRPVPETGWYDASHCHSPWWIEPFVEMKTIWHPSAT